MFKTIRTLAAAAVASTFLAAGIASAYEIAVRDFIHPGQTFTYSGYFFGNSYSFAELIGSGQSDLDIFIYDENWNLIDQSTSSGSYELAEWNPLWNGWFHIEVYNYGHRPSSFELYAN